MIKFFRRFRQGMIEKNRISKYLLYAIGEIILVVIGILIALQINNWNENQKEARKTSIYVENLIKDLQKDTLMYNDQLLAANLKYNYCKQISRIIQDGEAIQDTSSFIVNLQAAGRLTVPTLTDNTHKDLVSTGNLNLIDDKNSIEAIREYYSNPLAWWYPDYKEQLVNGYLPIVVDAIPMHLHEEILENESVVSVNDFTDKALTNNQVQGYTQKDVDEIMEYLKDNREFNFQLKRITRSHLVQIQILLLGKISAVALLKNLQDWRQNNRD